ncbi:Bifunctional protein GlmU [Sedimentisphaera cyanobacteriorum]|uniref:Bifunctional protein GlmU n=1 Tax=Sedimentisphaera cyanobacteriorum TaxID=1940790 RepID=A0A1Q2HNG9_9BACT|nr:hypothetical protein [Sedimentisphaera cyanobacteriorum]AQQ08881.1 Bifunctional protein GlmU [Sedimentisphaera cyanobacteriorum]
MKVVCYAAMESTECCPHTVNRPAAMLKALDKTVIEHNLLACGEAEEYIVFVGFEADKIIEKLGHEFNGVKVRFITASTKWQDCLTEISRSLVDTRQVLLFRCDKIYSKKDMQMLADEKNAKLTSYGEEVNAYSFDPAEVCSIADFDKRLKPLEVQDYCLALRYPWNYLEANVELVRRIKGRKIEGELEGNVVLKGDVHIAEGAVVKSGTYIEGPVFIDSGSVIGPFAYIRKDTVIGKGVQAGRMEVYDSVLMDGFTSKHISYAAHSVLGENCNFGAGTITADYRHDGGNHTTVVQDEKLDTGRRKLGAFIGDNVKTGIGTLIYPGRKLWPGVVTLPGEVIKKDRFNS